MSERPIDRWRTLRAAGVGDGVLEVPSLPSEVDSGFGAIRFAVGPKGQPRLLVPCGQGARLSGDDSPEKLSVTLSRFNVAGRSVVFIDLMSLEPSLDPVFAELASEILHRIGGGTVPISAVKGTISDFRELLRKEIEAEISSIQIYGLIGELVVLRNLVNFSPAALQAWTGPFEQRHDFRNGNHALEVKTSSRSDSVKVHVSSLEQLAEPSGGSLTLVHVRVEMARGGETCVAGLVAELLRNGAPRTELERGLGAAGCSDPTAAAWNRIRCNLEGISAYSVVSGFPRITAAQLVGGKIMEGVSLVEYAIDLSAARKFLLSSQETEAAFRRMVS